MQVNRRQFIDLVRGGFVLGAAGCAPAGESALRGANALPSTAARHPPPPGPSPKAAVVPAVPALVSRPTKAVLFDAFPIFDPRPVFALAEQLFSGRGAELSNAWRTRQFEYTWLRCVSNRYQDFWSVTEDALVFAAATLKLELPPAKRDQLMQAYLELNAYPDVAPALRALRDAGLRSWPDA